MSALFGQCRRESHEPVAYRRSSLVEIMAEASIKNRSMAAVKGARFQRQGLWAGLEE